MNFFSSDEFLSTVAEVFFPGRTYRIGTYRVAGRHYRLVAVAGRAPVTRGPFLDFLQPLDEHDEPAPGPVEELAYLPLAALETREVAGAPDQPPGTEPAPFIRWSAFRDWAAFQAHFASRRESLVRDSRTKRRNLTRELGTLAFLYDDPRPEVLEQCFAWKSAQYVRTGLSDMFRQRRNAELFRALRRKGALVVSSLTAGDTLLAVHVSGCWRNRLFAWVPAYDPDRFRFSPGRLLLEDLLRESQARGHDEFDFLIGGADYKWHYATHSRVVGPAGRRPRLQDLARGARERVRRAVDVCPPLLALLRRLRRRLAERAGPA